MLFETFNSWKLRSAAYPKALNKAVEWVQAQMKAPFKEGKVELSDGMYAIPQKYTTKDPIEFENHHKYIDLQILIAGTEWLYWTTDETADAATPYKPEKDIEFTKPKKAMKDYTKIVLEGNKFCLLWPGDWHMPCVKPSEDFNDIPKEVIKIVVKIPIDAK